MTHTPELWRQGKTLMTPQTRRWTPEQLALNDERESLFVFSNFNGEDSGRSRVLVATCYKKEDARRIVACVNACTGISTDTLIEYGDGNLEALFKMQQQRDELQDKCDELLAAIAVWESNPTTGKEFALKEAAAKARGQQ